MTTLDETIARLHALPEPLVQQVSDFIDFLLLYSDEDRWRLWKQFESDIADAEAGMPEYLTHIEEYEDRLAKGDLSWEA